MATLPTFPTFAFQSTPTVSTLNQLSGAVNFATQVPIVISLKRSSSQSVSASTTTAVQWNVSEADTDTMHSNATNPSRLTAQTQGYYRLHAVVSMAGASSAQEYQAYFRQTTGSNNPLGSGQTQVFGGNFSLSDGTSGDEMSLHISSMTPCLYVNDYVEVIVWCSAATSVANAYQKTGNNDDAGNADGGSCLYGYYAFEGP